MECMAYFIWSIGFNFIVKCEWKKSLKCAVPFTRYFKFLIEIFKIGPMEYNTNDNFPIILMAIDSNNSFFCLNRRIIINKCDYYPFPKPDMNII